MHENVTKSARVILMCQSSSKKVCGLSTSTKKLFETAAPCIFLNFHYILMYPFGIIEVTFDALLKLSKFYHIFTTTRFNFVISSKILASILIYFFKDY